MQDVLLALRPKSQGPFQKIDEFLSLVAKIGKLFSSLSLKVYQERLHEFFRFFIGESLVIIAALLPAEITWVDQLAFIPFDEDDLLFGIAILKEKADIDI